MSLEITHAVTLGVAEVCQVEHLMEVSGLSLEDIDDLIENGLIEPCSAPAAPRAFHLVHVVTVQRARRLRDDFQLDRNGMTLAMALVKRIDELEHALAAARAAAHH